MAMFAASHLGMMSKKLKIEERKKNILECKAACIVIIIAKGKGVA